MTIVLPSDRIKELEDALRVIADLLSSADEDDHLQAYRRALAALQPTPAEPTWRNASQEDKGYPAEPGEVEGERCPTCGGDEPAWPYSRPLTADEQMRAVPCLDPFHSPRRSDDG